MKPLYISKSVEETNEIAKSFAKIIESENIVYLTGPMGSGKTIFAKKLAEHFGINELISSSYNQVSLYNGKLNIIHCDFYRRSCDATLEIESLLCWPWLLLIEWPDERLSFNEKCSYHINFKKANNNIREIEFEKFS